MNYFEHIKEGLRNLFFAKLRSLLALLGILVGTASVVAMVLGGELATQEALRQFQTLGTDLLAISINSSSEEVSQSRGQSENLTLQQAKNLANVDPEIQIIGPYTQLFYPITYEGESVNAMILGVTHSFADLTKVSIKDGRFIADADDDRFFCVIGHDVYQAMKQISFKNPLGQALQIGNHIFIVVGVANSWPENGFLYANIDTAILVPIKASSVISKYAFINNLIARLSPLADINQVKARLENAIHSELSDKNANFRSAKELITKMRKQSDILTVFLGLIGGVSLLVGGIGVMNIMLVSVIERKKEIGIRLAVGARRRDIALLFLIESIILSLVGGLLGVMIGIGIAYVIAAYWQWPFTLFLLPPLIGFSVSVAVGIFSGFYPAYLAAKLNPIDALRSE